MTPYDWFNYGTGVVTGLFLCFGFKWVKSMRVKRKVVPSHGSPADFVYTVKMDSETTGRVTGITHTGGEITTEIHKGPFKVERKSQ